MTSVPTLDFELEGIHIFYIQQCFVTWIWACLEWLKFHLVGLLVRRLTATVDKVTTVVDKCFTGHPGNCPVSIHSGHSGKLNSSYQSLFFYIIVFRREIPMSHSMYQVMTQLIEYKILNEILQTVWDKIIFFLKRNVWLHCFFLKILFFVFHFFFVFSKYF